MSTIPCFLVKPTNWCMLYARRYSNEFECGEFKTYHNSMVAIGHKPIELTERGYRISPDVPSIPADSPLWEQKCSKCEYVFTEQDPGDPFTDRMYAQAVSEEQDVSHVSLDSGFPTISNPGSAIVVPVNWWPRRELPPGAMYREPLYRDMYWANDSEDPLLVITPSSSGGHVWNIDSRASNCTLPDERFHRCWVRQGTPPNITVGKNGNTCGAGAGSIAAAGYHGMLENGYLRQL